MCASDNLLYLPYIHKQIMKPERSLPGSGCQYGFVSRAWVSV